MPASRRASGVKPMALAGLLRAATAGGATDIALGIPPGRPPSTVVQAAISALTGERHQYADPAGLPALRQVIADATAYHRGVSVDPETEVTITCGATEAIFVALLAVTDPGDEVIVIEPYFEIYPGMVEAAGAVPRFVRLAMPGWGLDVAAIRRALTPRTRAVILNSPHNPTGRAFTAEELGALLELCAHNGLTCVVDEVYEHTMFDGARHVSPLQSPLGRAHAIVVGSLSKTLHMSGWRIGYCIADPATTALVRRMHERTTVGTSHPLQYGAAACQVTDPPKYAGLFAGARDLMVASLTTMGFDVHPPDGGWFVFAGTEKLGWPSGALAKRLVDSAGVLVAPGTAFFDDPAEGDRWIRTTFVRDARATAAALDRIGDFLRTERPPTMDNWPTETATAAAASCPA